MLLKPSLDDLPVEKELKEELDINIKKVQTSNRSIWFGFLQLSCLGHINKTVRL